jgi:hypothetical protein
MRGTIGRGKLRQTAGEGKLAPPQARSDMRPVWNEPYLETCCRSALHRLWLCGDAGRPPGLKDARCLERLIGMGLARRRPDGRHEQTADGIARHAAEVLRRG